jgi:predicted Zn-dependent protease
LVITLGVASAQTPVNPPKNSYEPAEDVKVGQQAAAQVRQQLTMFRYSFDVVNMREINAFALPGGPMFLNRGMIQAAQSEGEVAGVMAHELSHVILRHGTAQATKGQKAQIGAIAGQILGAIVGGNEGAYIAQGSELLAGGFMLKYSRDYERQADLLGAQIMASAGYNPRDMSRMFETIARQGGSRGPEWLSSHPDPGNRSAAINREAEQLQVRGNAGSRAEFQSVKSRLAQMSPAPTAAQVESGQVPRNTGTTGTSGRTARVEPPSSEWSTYQAGDALQISVPSNWREIAGNNGSVTYAPDGGYSDSAFTHGVQVGVAQIDGSSNLQQATEQLLQAFAQNNPNLRRQGNYARTTISGQQALTATLSNQSEQTGQPEVISLSTVPMDNGGLLFILGVAPQNEARTYQNTFGRIRQSLRIR